MAHDVVLIPGDGIGPEITQAMRRVVEATGVQINWNVQEVAPASWTSLARRCPSTCSTRLPRLRLPSRAPSPRRSARVSAALTSPCASTSTCTPACAPACRSRATARASATSTWSSCARTPRTSMPVSSSMRRCRGRGALAARRALGSEDLRRGFCYLDQAHLHRQEPPHCGVRL